MSIVRYNNGWGDFTPTTFNSLIDRFFNDSIDRFGGTSHSFVPQVDVIERDKAFEINLAAPGMNKEDFKVDVDQNRLIIEGERKWSEDRKDVRRREMHYGAFRREFVLPDEVDGERVEARYEKGILSLVLPKSKKLQRTTIKVA